MRRPQIVLGTNVLVSGLRSRRGSSSALLTEEYLEARARRGSRERYEMALAEGADVEPDEWDR